MYWLQGAGHSCMSLHTSLTCPVRQSISAQSCLHSHVALQLHPRLVMHTTSVLLSVGHCEGWQGSGWHLPGQDNRSRYPGWWQSSIISSSFMNTATLCPHLFTMKHSAPSTGLYKGDLDPSVSTSHHVARNLDSMW